MAGIDVLNDDAPGRPPRPLARRVLLSALVLACAGFLALGAWQVQRLAWKKDLIARVTQRQAAAPQPAPGPSDWPAMSRGTDEYRRIQVSGRFDHQRETLVRASTEYGTGYWVMTPLETEQGFWVFINRGFVAADRRDPSARGSAAPAGTVQVTGLLRLNEPDGSLLQSNEPATGRWYSRDVHAMARMHGLDRPSAVGGAAPYFIDAVADPAKPEAWPRGGLTILRFSNNHWVYALTWFALAAMSAGAFGYVLVEGRSRRPARSGPPGEPPSDAPQPPALRD